jgi:hypothetical protein
MASLVTKPSFAVAMAALAMLLSFTYLQLNGQLPNTPPRRARDSGRSELLGTMSLTNAPGDGLMKFWQGCDDKSKGQQEDGSSESAGLEGAVLNDEDSGTQQDV